MSGDSFCLLALGHFAPEATGSERVTIDRSNLEGMKEWIWIPCGITWCHARKSLDLLGWTVPEREHEITDVPTKVETPNPQEQLLARTTNTRCKQNGRRWGQKLAIWRGPVGFESLSSLLKRIRNFLNLPLYAVFSCTVYFKRGIARMHVTAQPLRAKGSPLAELLELFNDSPLVNWS